MTCVDWPRTWTPRRRFSTSSTTIFDTSNNPDADGIERWWIGDRLDEKASPNAPPFTNVWFEDDELRAYAFDGYEYHFEPETGALLDQIWKK